MEWFLWIVDKGPWAILVSVIVVLGAWAASHYSAKAGTEVSVFFGLAKYTKRDDRIVPGRAPRKYLILVVGGLIIVVCVFVWPAIGGCESINGRWSRNGTIFALGQVGCVVHGNSEPDKLSHILYLRVAGRNVFGYVVRTLPYENKPCVTVVQYNGTLVDSKTMRVQATADACDMRNYNESLDFTRMEN